MIETPTERVSLKYTGLGSEMAILMLKNLFLTIFTLGIYRAWAKTATRRYIWGNVVFIDDRAAYMGTGEELFKGWLKLIGLIVLVVIASRILGHFIPFAQILVPITYGVTFGLATYSGLRYRMSRTVWRQIRFGVDKDEASTKEFLKLYLLGGLVTGLTLGMYYPWFKNRLRTYLTNKSRFGTNYFSYDGDSNEYAKIYWFGIFLCVVTVGIYTPWLIRNLEEYRLNHTYFQGKRVLFTLRGKHLLGFGLVAYFGTILTLGLATPWIFNWGLHIFVENIHMDGLPDFNLVEAKASDGSALGDDIVSGYDLDLGF